MTDYATAFATPALKVRPLLRDRQFYIGVAVFMIVLNAVAFGPPILNPSTRKVPLPITPLVMAHAAVSASWLFLFLAQAILVATGRAAMHRRVGVAGVVLTALFLVLGWFTTLEQARRGYDLSGTISRLPAPPGLDPVAGTVGILFFFLTFGVLAAAAFYYRRRPAVHKRLMLLALIGGLASTPLTHLVGNWSTLQPWANVFFPVTFAALLTIGPVYDRVSEGRIHPVSLWGGVAVFAWIATFQLAIIPSASWRQFAHWLI